MTGYVYALVSRDNGATYVGSTLLTMKERISHHHSDFESWKTDKSPYMTSFEILKGDYEVKILLELPECSKEELRQKEQEFIDSTESHVNKFRAWRPQGYQKEYSKRYWDRNKDVLNEKHRQYYHSIKNTPEYKEKRKAYYEAHAENEKARARKHRESNAEGIKEWKRTVVDCPCGRQTSKGDKARHEKSQFHIQWASSQENLPEPQK